MTHSITMRVGISLSILALAFGASFITVSAHGDEEHDEDAATAEIENMESLIDLLTQLVTLMQALKIQQGYAPVVVLPTHVETTTDVDHEADATEEEHDHAAMVESDEVSKLIIEVEEHHEDTHVHVRYTDKPEVMFFVDADITDEDALVGDIHEETGLDESEIREALKYL